jgi:hypothetical protein
VRRRQRHVREVGAGNQEDEERGAEQEQHRPFDVGGHRLAERVHRGAKVQVDIRVCRFEACADGEKFRSRRCDGHARLQSGDAIVHVLLACDLRMREILAEIEWNPDRLVVAERESSRHDADHVVLLVVQRDGAAHDACIGAELALPEGVREDDFRVGGRSALTVHERSAAPCAHSEHVERVRGHLGHRHDLRIGRSDSPGGDAREVCRDSRERMLLRPIIGKVRRREPAAALRFRRSELGEAHEGAGRSVRQRLQEDRAGNAEDRGVRADRERERQDGHDREARTPAQRAERVRSVL